MLYGRSTRIKTLRQNKRDEFHHDNADERFYWTTRLPLWAKKCGGQTNVTLLPQAYGLSGIQAEIYHFRFWKLLASFSRLECSFSRRSNNVEFMTKVSTRANRAWHNRDLPELTGHLLCLSQGSSAWQRNLPSLKLWLSIFPGVPFKL